MRGQMIVNFLKKRVVGLLIVALAAFGLCVGARAQSDSDLESNAPAIARGGGTTIVEGGTGKTGGFIPVLTTLAFFHAEKAGNAVTGSFECLARAPEASTGSGSAEFTVNAMYVTGRIKGAAVRGDTATLTGTAGITGLGAGSDVPFTFVVRKGGPAATAVLTTEGSPRLVFNEVLLEGSFQVFSDESRGPDRNRN